MNDILTFGNISLRPLEPDDIDLLYRWENDMEVWMVSNTKTPYSKYILAQYIKESIKDIYETRQLRLIIQNEKQKAVGAVDLFDFEPYHLRAGVGILIHKKDDRNKGYASNSLEALSKYAIEVLGLRQLYANISADNLNSISLFEKAGFKKTGVKKDWLKVRDGWKDEIILQKLL
ncbi:MAG: GNAT family N-acetyltransferase [Prolixibacteraceae bacterium]|nr:GNAT family N-acetyltransferase [Prolixibacteraceae bacterium]